MSLIFLHHYLLGNGHCQPSVFICLKQNIHRIHEGLILVSQLLIGIYFFSSFHFLLVTATVIVTTVQIVSARESVFSGKERSGSTCSRRETGWRYGWWITHFAKLPQLFLIKRPNRQTACDSFVVFRIVVACVIAVRIFSKDINGTQVQLILFYINLSPWLYAHVQKMHLKIALNNIVVCKKSI